LFDYVNQWQDETCFIIGGGPSAKDACDKWGRHIRESGCRIIVVNDAFLLFPDADILYFGDKPWWDWHRNEILEKFTGQIFTKTAKGGKYCTHLRASDTALGEDFDWSDSPGVLGGRDSGHQAVNLAAHLGVSAIFLVGFDMRKVGGKANWHDRHLKHKPRGASDDKHEINFVPGYRKVAIECARRNILVFNLNVDSALEVFPKLEIGRLFSGD
jgi:hypothetical protein